jgi:acetyl-CoA C-acetyltransferase
MSGKNKRDPVILSSARTAQGRLMGVLSGMTAAELGQVAYKAAIERSGIDSAEIDEVLVGNVVSTGVGQALPRQISIGAGVPEHVGGVAINKVCGSGLKAIMLSASAIKADDGNLYVAGGAESMSNVPHFSHLRNATKYGTVEMQDAIEIDGLKDAFSGWLMGNAAEFIGKQLEVTREEMDEFAYRSHKLAHEATEAGKFKAEIEPITIKTRKAEFTVDSDEPIRPETSVEALAKLGPAFEQDGQVTAGNAPGLNDGSAAVVVSSRDYAEKKGHDIVARIVAYGQAAVEPKWIFYAPVKAVPIALKKAGWTHDEVDLYEFNEAFAAQVLADMRGLEREGYPIPLEKINVNGGAIALGHPLGASGARVLVTLIHALQDRGLKKGLAALCLGGGEAVAMAIELEN